MASHGGDGYFAADDHQMPSRSSSSVVASSYADNDTDDQIDTTDTNDNIDVNDEISLARSVLQRQEHRLAATFEAITGGESRVRSRFFDGSRRSDDGGSIGSASTAAYQDLSGFGKDDPGRRQGIEAAKPSPLGRASTTIRDGASYSPGSAAGPSSARHSNRDTATGSERGHGRNAGDNTNGRNGVDSATRMAVMMKKLSPVRTTQVQFEIVDGQRVAVKMHKAIAKHSVTEEAPRDASTQPQARWPHTLDMAPTPPTHIYYAPDYREPFYTGPQGSVFNSTSLAAQAKARATDEVAAKSHAFGGSLPRAGSDAESRKRYPETIVYTRVVATDGYFLGKTKTYHPNDPPLPPSYTPTSSSDDTLVFDSRFESGNLAEAKRTGPSEYDLQLQTDMYTDKHTQWFYFSVSNMQKGRSYTFRINNLLKGDSLYNHGMQPVLYSTLRSERDRIGWVRGGTHTRYYRNTTKVPFSKGDRYMWNVSTRNIVNVNKMGDQCSVLINDMLGYLQRKA